MTPLDSSNLAGYEYDDATRQLTIHFKSGSSYAYHNVPHATVQGLAHASSAGSFFHKNIKDKYKNDQV